MAEASIASYEARLERRCGAVGSVLCAGIDPAPDSLGLITDAGSNVIGQLERFSGMIVESVRDVAAAVKFQVAWYELHGADGLRALERSILYARRAGLIVIADAKRGDIPHSAEAYAQAWLSTAAPLQSDALTVNASVGSDALEAMMAVARPAGGQLYALAHTSNTGAVALQAAQLSTGEPWWHSLARSIEQADAGAVVGATHEHVLREARDLLPTAPLLIPGVGAQGGSVSELGQLVTEQAAPLLVAASRSLLPDGPGTTQEFRQAVMQRATALARDTAPLVPRAHLRTGAPVG